MKKAVLKNNQGKVIRVFYIDSDKIYVLYRSNKGRIDFCSSPDFFKKDSLILIDEISLDSLKKYKVPYMSATLELCDSDFKEIELPADTPLPVFSNKSLYRIFAMVMSFYIVTAVGLYASQPFSFTQKPLPEEQRLVKVLKSPPASTIQPKKMFLASKSDFISTKPKASNKKIKKSLKTMGALSVLGSLSQKPNSSQNLGGINLGERKVSAGPGFRSLAGSTTGGVQSQLYSKGMISSALGTGGNIRGGGGHGTKGTQAGGGAEGYGKLNLIGSRGAQDLSSTKALNTEPGTFDLSIIDREIIKNREKIRQCYLKALETESDLKGLFEFVFQVNPNGKVVFSDLSPSSEVQSSKVSSCIFKVIKSVHFPIRSQKKAQINYAFDLSDLEGGS